MATSGPRETNLTAETWQRERDFEPPALLGLDGVLARAKALRAVLGSTVARR
jgi:hypothetical protein